MIILNPPSHRPLPVFFFFFFFNDTATTEIYTLSLHDALPISPCPGVALGMAAAANVLGALISTEVAATLGKGVVETSAVTQMVVLAALVGAVTWNFITWYYGIPSSSSHALIGGL